MSIVKVVRNKNKIDQGCKGKLVKSGWRRISSHKCARVHKIINKNNLRKFAIKPKGYSIVPSQARMGVQCMDQLSTTCVNNFMYMNPSSRSYWLGGTHCYGDIPTQSNYSGGIRLYFYFTNDKLCSWCQFTMPQGWYILPGTINDLAHITIYNMRQPINIQVLHTYERYTSYL